MRTRRLTLINSNYFKLEVSREDKKIYLLVYDMNKKLIEKLSYIDFYSLEERIMLKLSNLSLIYASKTKKENSQYFRYYKIVFYKIKDFDIFLDLLEKDKIEVTLCARVSRSGVECGRQRKKNLVFKILKESVDELLNIILTHLQKQMKPNVYGKLTITSLLLTTRKLSLDYYC